MQFWEDIVNIAMIGTDKKVLDATTLPQEMSQPLDNIQMNTALDSEEKFLQNAALLFNYKQSGWIPAYKKDAVIDAAPPEEKTYCSAGAVQCIKDILSEESIPLLQLWLEECNEKQQVVTPAMVPSLLAAGVQHKKLQWLVYNCCGKRGEWLAKFNPQWLFSANETAEQAWQTGTLEVRKNILKETREQNPALALEWLQQTWKEEDANVKTAFLGLLRINISELDLPFLESLSTEKSKKVKDESLFLQQRIPASSIVLRYQTALQSRVNIIKEKALLGLTSNFHLNFEYSPLEEDIYKSGIEKLSNNKTFTDDEYVMFQLIESVPPLFWQNQLQVDPVKVINYFQHNEVGKKMMSALVNATVKFQDKEFAIYLMQTSEVFYIDILPLLPPQQQDQYSIEFFASYPEEILRYATQYKQEWSIDLAKLIFQQASKNPYQYSKSFFNNNVELIPAAIIPELEKFVPAEDYYKTMWINTSQYVSKIVGLKNSIKKSFKA